MYIRRKASSNGLHTKVQIVESVRQGKIVRQKIVRHVGTATDDRELEQLLSLAKYAIAKIEDEREPRLFSPEEMTELSLKNKAKQEKSPTVHVEDLFEESRHVVGIHDVYGEVYKDLGFDRILKNPARQKLDCDYLRHITLARIADPNSKRKSVDLLEHNFGVSLNLDRVYRLMDKIDEESVKRIQNLSWTSVKQALALFKQKIDVLFYDATTLYFESFTSDDLKQNGYSKDGKFNQPQVVLTLFVTQDGLPVGYDVFPGSTYEGHTLIVMLEQLKQRFDIGKIIFVADSGLLNENNLKLLEHEGYTYIVGARLKNLSNALQRQVTDQSRFQELNEDLKTQEIPLQAKRKLIVSYSEKRARKDQHDRQQNLEKLMKKLKKSKNPESLISHYGYKKYLTIQGQSEVVLHEAKLQEEEKWDGLHGVITNAKEMNVGEIIGQYKGLWQIEETFRVSKHDLKIRPIFHWSPARVRSHIALCYMALCCVRYLEYRVKNQYQKLSPEVIRENLLSVQASLLVHKPSSKKYLLPSTTREHASKIYHVMGLKLATQPFQI